MRKLYRSKLKYVCFFLFIFSPIVKGGSDDDYRFAGIMYIALGSVQNVPSDVQSMNELRTAVQTLAEKVTDNTEALENAITPKKLAYEPSRDKLKPSKDLAVYLPATTKKMLYDFDQQLRDRRRESTRRPDGVETNTRVVAREETDFYKEAVRITSQNVYNIH